MKSPSTGLNWQGCPQCKNGEPQVKQDTAEGCIMACTSCGWTGPFSACWTKEPPIAGSADVERESRLDAQRVTLQFGQKSNRRFDNGKMSIEDSPLFGGNRQGVLFA